MKHLFLPPSEFATPVHQFLNAVKGPGIRPAELSLNQMLTDRRALLQCVCVCVMSACVNVRMHVCALFATIYYGNLGQKVS